MPSDTSGSGPSPDGGRRRKRPGRDRVNEPGRAGKTGWRMGRCQPTQAMPKSWLSAVMLDMSGEPPLAAVVKMFCRSSASLVMAVFAAGFLVVAAPWRIFCSACGNAAAAFSGSFWSAMTSPRALTASLQPGSVIIPASCLSCCCIALSPESDEDESSAVGELSWALGESEAEPSEAGALLLAPPVGPPVDPL